MIIIVYINVEEKCLEQYNDPKKYYSNPNILNSLIQQSIKDIRQYYKVTDVIFEEYTTENDDTFFKLSITTEEHGIINQTNTIKTEEENGSIQQAKNTK